MAIIANIILASEAMLIIEYGTTDINLDTYIYIYVCLGWGIASDLFIEVL